MATALSLGEAKQRLDALFKETRHGSQHAALRTQDLARGAGSSAWVQKAVIGTSLLALAGALLYIPAALGYLFFYYKFLPALETTVPVHLQYGVGPNPFGIAPLGGIANRQPYDISVSLTLPRSPTNLEHGNFMVALHLLSPSTNTPRHQSQTTIPYLPPARSTPDSRSSWEPNVLDALLQPTRLNLPSYLASHTILYTSTRPALIPYVDPLVSLSSRMLFLLYHMLVPHSTASTVHLTVPMAEGLVVDGGSSRDQTSTSPPSLLLEVQAGQSIQVYEARVTLVARLRGLRGFMYRWRVTAFVLCSAAVWVVEMVVLGMAVLVVGQVFGTRPPGLLRGKRVEEEEELGHRLGKKIKEEEESMEAAESSASPSAPAPLSGKGKGAVKKEEEGEEGRSRVPEFEVGTSTEADDEAETGKGKGKGKGKEKMSESEDVGVGTSYSGHASQEGARRRNVSGQEETPETST